MLTRIVQHARSRRAPPHGSQTGTQGGRRGAAKVGTLAEMSRALRVRARRCALVMMAWLAPAVARAQQPTEGPAEGPAEAEVEATDEPAARPPAVEVQTLKRARHDWYAGFEVGLGAGNLRRTEEGSNALSAALLGQVRGGGRIRDGLLIGGLATTVLGGARRGQGLFNVMAEIIGYPLRGRGLMMSAALGGGAYVQTRGSGTGDEEDMTTINPQLSGAVGIAFGVGLGYEFWLSRRFNIGIVARGDGLAMRKFGLRAAGTLGLSFAWY